MPPILLKLLPWFIALALAGAIYYIGDIKGTTGCELKQASDKVADAGRAQLAITKVGEQYAPELKQLEEAKDSGTAVGPLTSHAIDSLRPH